MRRTVGFLLAAAWGGIIYYGSCSGWFTSASTSGIIRHSLEGASDVTVAAVNYTLRKCAHLFLFASLAMFLRMLLEGSRRPYLYAWAAASTFGAADEIQQLYVPGRQGMLTDAFIDMAAACFGLVLYRHISRKLRRPVSRPDDI